MLGPTAVHLGLHGGEAKLLERVVLLKSIVAWPFLPEYPLYKIFLRQERVRKLFGTVTIMCVLIFNQEFRALIRTW